VSKISGKKEARIKEDILAILFENSPKALFTKEVADAIIRDEEFTKRLLAEMKNEGLTREITLSEKGKAYAARRRWQLTEEAFKAYQKLAHPDSLS